jgi:lysophospholipase L1-like esterase
MLKTAAVLGVLSSLVSAAAPPPASPKWEPADGDRVVLLGNTLIERDAAHGWLETRLTLRRPDRSVTFRNLGWSGDTVFGHARAGFGNVADGFKNLREHVAAAKPTVLLIAYGTNESFDGPAGLPAFVKGLETLLDAVGAGKPRVILISPLRQENHGPPLPDPAAHNRNLRLYADAVRDVAAKRGLTYLDVFDLTAGEASSERLTDNGVHLSPAGYWKFAEAVERALGLAASAWRIEVSADGRRATGTGAEVAGVETTAGSVSFCVTDAALPIPAARDEAGKPVGAGSGRTVAVPGLPEGRWTLTIDGAAVATAGAAEWAAGVTFASGPDHDQAETLRQAVNEKNRRHFHRWRPQNETYLFGFRKHEQGRNAAEVPQFDPLVEAKEKEIAALRKPSPRRYEIVRATGGE